MIKIINSDEKITVSGFLDDVSTEDITVVLYDPDGNAIYIIQITSNQGHYSEIFYPNSLWGESGVYTVKVSYSSEISTNFNYAKDKSEPKKLDCDLSYPDFCIAPNILDLDCDDIAYTNFSVPARPTWF